MSAMNLRLQAIFSGVLEEESSYVRYIAEKVVPEIKPIGSPHVIGVETLSSFQNRISELWEQSYAVEPHQEAARLPSVTGKVIHCLYDTPPGPCNIVEEDYSNEIYEAALRDSLEVLLYRREIVLEHLILNSDWAPPSGTIGDRNLLDLIQEAHEAIPYGATTIIMGTQERRELNRILGLSPYASIIDTQEEINFELGYPSEVRLFSTGGGPHWKNIVFVARISSRSLRDGALFCVEPTALARVVSSSLAPYCLENGKSYRVGVAHRETLLQGTSGLGILYTH